MNKVILSGTVINVSERERIPIPNELTGEDYTCFRYIALGVEDAGTIFLYVTGEIFCEKVSRLYHGEEIEVVGKIEYVLPYNCIMIHISHLAEKNPKPIKRKEYPNEPKDRLV